MKELVLNVESMPYGAMLWWEKRDDEVASYTVRLYIGKSASDCTEICRVDKDRHTSYHTFSGLAKSAHSYFAEVVAENRQGEIVAKCDKKCFGVSDSFADLTGAINDVERGMRNVKEAIDSIGQDVF